MRPRHLATAAAVAWLLVASISPHASAQVSVGVSAVRERSIFHFDAPSSYDTTDLVPHFFEQRYVLDNVWFHVAIDYRAGARWRTRVSATPVRQALATDYDTFYNPDGNVWVAGTTGDARVHSLRIEQQVDAGRTGPIVWTGGYRLRLDAADFLAGLRTDTRNGILIASRIVTTAERTLAQVHEVFFRAEHARPLGAVWQLDLTADASPALLTRLAIQLPDKYPGQTLVYHAPGLGATAGATLTRRHQRWPVSIYVEAGRLWRYRSTQRAERTTATAGIALRRNWP